MWLLFSVSERSTAFLYNDIMLTSKAGPNAFVSHWRSFGSRVSDWLWHHCYIISFILNSRFGQRYWLRELFAFGSKNSRAPICIPAAALFQSCYFILPARCVCSSQWPALHIRFARQSCCSIFLVYVLLYRLYSNIQFSGVRNLPVKTHVSLRSVWCSSGQLIVYVSWEY